MVGIDIVETKRFKKKANEKIFNKVEIEYASTFSNPEVHYAGFWAAKEAFLKAIGTGITSKELYKIYVYHDKSNKPLLHIPEQIKDQHKLLNKNIELSISHTTKLATAICIIN